jgi:hypothetical protein
VPSVSVLLLLKKPFAMSRHLIRGSAAGSVPREQAADRSRRRGSTSALSGHLDYVELAERVAQGVTVTNAEDDPPAKSRRRTPRRRS